MIDAIGYPHKMSLSALWERWKRWRNTHLAGSIDQAKVLHDVEENSRWSYGYLFYIFTSAAIAILGLLQNSPAVIIGAMLVAPLMGPIMGMGFSLATFDFRAMKRAGKAALYGSIIAVAFTMFIVFLSPIKALTPELAARTQPNLLDLGVAFFSGLAGAYATIRNKGGTIVGVAIATALMPPLATVGFGLATGSIGVAGGAFLLFMTNFMTIAFTTTIMARIFGFGHYLSDKQTRFQAIGIVTMFALLAIPLALTLATVTREAKITNDISTAILDSYGNGTQVEELSVNFDGSPVDVQAIVITPTLLDDKEMASLTQKIEGLCGAKARVQLTQLRAESSAAVLERERIRALANDAISTVEKTSEITGWVQQTTGLPRDAILVDSARKRVEFTLPQNAEAPYTWQTLRQIEIDAEAAFPGWSVRIDPPLLDPLPVTIESEGGAVLDPVAAQLMGWASQRLHRPLLISQNNREAANVVAAIQVAGGSAQIVDDDEPYRWGDAD